MRIGVPKETAAGERRVALVPEVVAKLVEAGHEVVVERGGCDRPSDKQRQRYDTWPGHSDLLVRRYDDTPGRPPASVLSWDSPRRRGV